MAAEPVSVPEISNVVLQDDHIMEVSPERDVVWEWWGHEHADELGLSDQARRIISETGGGQPPRVAGDWLHLNTIHKIPENPHHDRGDERFAAGNLLICARNLNLIFVIDKQSGTIVWRWGAPPPMPAFWINGTRGTDRYLVGPHDPKMLKNGNILIYDNGGGGGYPPVVRFFTRLVEMDPATGEIVWEYVNPRGGLYRTQRVAYEDCPEAEPYFMETDGHLGAGTAQSRIPAEMGMPTTNGVDYCPAARQ